MKTGFWNVGRKTTAAAVVVVAIAMATATAWQSARQRGQLEQLATDDLSTVTFLIAKQLKGAVQWKKIAAIERIYEPLATQAGSTLVGVSVFDADGEALSQWQREGHGDPPARVDLTHDSPVVVMRADGYQVVSAPVVNPAKGTLLGSVSMRWSMQSVNALVADAVVFQAVSAAVVALLLVWMLHLVTRRLLSRPLTAAVAFCQAVAAGRLDNSLSVHSDDEIGVLSNSLRTMQEELRERAERDRQQLEEIQRLQDAAQSARIQQALDNVAASVLVADSEQRIIYANAALMRMMHDAQDCIREASPAFDADALVGSELGVFRFEDAALRGAATADESVDVTAEQAGRTFRIIVNPVVDEDSGERLGSVWEWMDLTQEVAVEAEMSLIVERAKSGNLTRRIGLEGKHGFVAGLSKDINELLDVSEKVVNDIVGLMQALSNGDLTFSIDSRYEGVFGQMMNDANDTTARLNKVLSNVLDMSQMVSLGTAEIAQGNQELAQRTTEQAGSLETTTSAMEQVLTAVRTNAASAERATALADRTRSTAEAGGDVVNNAVRAMDEINQSSREIADIARIIDDIASQTNLLALNAAVEAARAGDQGKGFGVVATEVRTLAQRCATAAKEIRELIQDSVTKVDEGYKLVNASGETLEGIVASIHELSSIVKQISAASLEQSQGIEVVNEAMLRIDEATAQSAAMVEETAVASSEMGEQAQSMQRMMDFFKLTTKSYVSAAGAD